MSNFTGPGPGPDDPYQGQRPPQPPYQPAAPGPSPVSEADDRQWASLAHLGGILMFLPSLVLWLLFKDRGPLTGVEAKEALNFQITLLIGYFAVNFFATVIGFLTFGIGGVIGGLAWVLYILGVVFSVLGYLQAKDGNHYRYPFALRLIK
ncbi:DUF4870 domain-containing protein [Cryobacterium sinapicolor]|uniref:DUF4870 domain-containing protein n=1 Tax=Cryobacterium sinapicolor TaxID=1259236 RepID=A0ABY2IV81_9MICO|nr:MULTISPECIES: DUF4870 domain-containing protein [Cryobacterium]TFC93460.1 DUF4870 domain-containing protein [Cryobacterium sp. TMT3-29-2]TFC95502.1 DUF4870 domain-containing protein [Cryobacterium sinapicolor]